MGKPVCDDGWDYFAANRVCKDLNYTRALRPTMESQYGLVPQSFSLDDVQCIGNETSLNNCTASRRFGTFGDVENCDGTEGAGVVCDTRSQQEVDEWNQRLISSCFAFASFSSMEYIRYNKSSIIEAPFTDNAASCQAVCASTEGCDVFTFELGTERGGEANR